MNNLRQPQNKKEKALRWLNTARVNLLVMIILTVVNIIVSLLGVDIILLFSASYPYYTAVIGILSGVTAVAIRNVTASVLVLVIYLLCWIFSKKHYGWMITALVLFSLDTIMMADIYFHSQDITGISDILIHILVLCYLIAGVINGYKLKHLSPEDEWQYERLRAGGTNYQAVTHNRTAPRRADTEVKFRVLAEGDFAGHHICYRRVKRTNELVVDGYVYDEVQMLVETPHQLNASVDGHNISAGLDGSCSFISIDGQQVAKKIRLI